MSALTELVIRYFAVELELALRAAFQEVVGHPLPLRFTLALESPPEQTSKAADRPRPRRTQGRSAQPPKRHRAVAKPVPAREGR